MTSAFVAYGTYRLANWIYDTWMDGDSNDIDDDDKDGNNNTAENTNERHPLYQERGETTFRNFNSNRTWLLRRQRMKRCRQETMQALQAFLPTLCRIVEEQTKTTLETQALKKIRAQRRKQQQQQKQPPLHVSSPPATTTSPAKEEDSKSAAVLGDDVSTPPVTPLQETKDDDDKEKNSNNNNNNNRAQEVQLWNVIKIQSVTRMMATAYAHTVLFLVLTVQVHLLGARLWNEQFLQQQQQQQEQGEFSAAAFQSSSTESSSDNYSYQESHRYVLLHTYEYFFEQGLGLLIQTVERAVEQVLKDWNVLDAAFLHVSHATFDEAIDKIRLVVEELNSSNSSSNDDDDDASQGGGGGGGGGGMTRRRHCPRNLLRFLMHPTAAANTGQDNNNEDDDDQGTAIDAAGDPKNSNDALKVAQAILDETWDLLESPVLKDAQQDCLNATFDLMRQESWGQIFLDDTTAGVHHQEGDDAMTTTRPLAHILTQLKKASSSFYATTVNNDNNNDMATSVDVQPIIVNSYCQAMEQLPSVLEVGDVSFN